MSLTVDSCYNLAGILSVAGVLITVLALALLLVRRPTPAQQRRALRVRLAILAIGVVLALGGGASTYAAGACAPAPPKCAGLIPDGRANLLANPGFAAGPKGTPVAEWTISGTLQPGAPAGWVQPTADSDLQAARVGVQPGEHLCYSVETGGSGHVQALLRWQSATLQGRIADTVQAPQAVGGRISGEGTAPAGAAYAWLWLRAIDGAPTFHAPVLGAAGAHVEPWPDGAAAALAFSFDWETAMGGLIHSKSQHDRAYAEARGLNMRQGADILLDLFGAQHIQGTFYATGYNLLDGNPQHQQFAGNPTYKWGPEQGWATTWWITNTWYSDDPYGTVASAPAWYFGDQADRIAAAGQEIGSHTFGHLYVRGTKPISLSLDLDTWVAAAAARRLPPARSFAFPWESSNSLTPDFYAILAAHGFNSVTRFYPSDLQDYYAIGAVPRAPDMAIMPDILLGVAGQNAVEGQVAQAADAAAGQAVLAEVVARRGVTSFWNHPEELTIPAVQQTWRDVVAAAAAARDRGDLWIAPVSTIVQRRQEAAQVAVTTAANDSRIEITVVDRAPDALDGVTLTLPRPAGAVQIDGVAASQRRPEQVVIPHLVPGQTVRIVALVRAGSANR